MQKNCVFHCVHKEIEILDNVFQSNCSSHAELLTNLRKIETRPKIQHKAVMHPALQLINERPSQFLTQLKPQAAQAHDEGFIATFIIRVCMGMRWICRKW